MSALSLADIERERKQLLSRQDSNNEFLASPEVPLAHRGKTLDEWTAWKRNWYETTKTSIDKAFERLREQEERIRSSLAAEPVPVPVPVTVPVPVAVAHQHTDFPPAELIVKLSDPNYGLFDRPDVKGLIKFYIYYYNAVKYPKKGTFAEQVDAQVIHTKQLLDRIKSHAGGQIGKAEYIVNHFIQTRTDGVANPDEHTIDAMHQMYKNIYGQDGGHKSARRVKSKCRSRSKSRSKSKCRSKSKSKKHICRG